MAQLVTKSAKMRIVSLLLLLLLLLQGTLTLPPGGCREVWRILERCNMREHCDLLADADVDYEVLRTLTALCYKLRKFS